MQNESQTFDAWAIVELFGHTVIAGHVTEQVIAGQGYVRVDVPATERREAFTRLIGPSAIYSIIPTTEEIATAFARRNVEAPISPWQLAQRELPAPTRFHRSDEVVSVETEDDFDAFQDHDVDDDPDEDDDSDEDDDTDEDDRDPDEDAVIRHDLIEAAGEGEGTIPQTGTEPRYDYE